MKYLQILRDKDRLDGYALITDENNYEIYVNLEVLWKNALKTKNREDNFIRYFDSTYTHELLHCVVKGCYRNAKRWEFGEEIVIWKIMNEKLTKCAKKYYYREFKKKT